jgi:hexosaminidase
MYKIALTLITIVFCLCTTAQQLPTIVPYPNQYTANKGLPFKTILPVNLIIDSSIDKNLLLQIKLFEKYCTENWQMQFNKIINRASQSLIIKTLPSAKVGYYKINISQNEISIIGSKSGVFYALETLKQLQQNKQLPACTIEDAPRFAYRGMHLDVARHFFSVAEVKRYIDYLAAFRFNTFHFHLTDDQGWRIEIKKYPKLTSVGGFRAGTIIGRYPGVGNTNKRYGGFYTQNQIKEIVQYAESKYINVIPEIEMPGHAMAALASYPYLGCKKEGHQVQQTWGVFDDVFCAGNDSTFVFLENVLSEVLPLFNSKYIHIGGDECPKTSWKTCTDCQNRIKKNQLKDEHELQSYFIQRMEKFVNKKGKQIIGWDEILEGGLAPNATVMSWRGISGGIEAAKQNHNVIMTPGKPLYFDHSQSQNEDSVTIGGLNTLEDVYNYEPIPKELNSQQAKLILGAQANVWTEYMTNFKKVEYQIFPRMVALSEVLWTNQKNKDFTRFESSLPNTLEKLKTQHTNYSTAYFDIIGTVQPTPNHTGVLWQLQTKSKEPITINKNMWDTIWRYQKPELIKETSMMYAYNNKQHLQQAFAFNKATGKLVKAVEPASKRYAGNGAFTVVDGVQSLKGFAKAAEYLGYEGTNAVFIVDAGNEIETVGFKVHTLHQPNNWIHGATNVTIYISNDDMRYEPILTTATRLGNSLQTILLETTNKIPATRYFKFEINNIGLIPAGYPGTGKKAWLFIDEIEIL